MSGEQEIYSFRARESGQKKEEVQAKVEMEESKEKNQAQKGELLNMKQAEEIKKLNVFQGEEKELIIESKDQSNEQELTKAPEYLSNKKEIISSHNLMLVENKRKPKKRMFLKSNSFQVEPIRPLNHKSCPTPNVVRFKFAVNFEDRMINKTEKSVDSVSYNVAVGNQNAIESKMINPKFPQENLNNKIQIESGRSKKGILICCSKESNEIS